MIHPSNGKVRMFIDDISLEYEFNVSFSSIGDDLVFSIQVFYGYLYRFMLLCHYVLLEN